MTEQHEGMPHPGECSDAAEPRRFAVNAVHAMRTAQVNTLTLSRMADHKASILMGATFLVFSLAVSRSVSGDMPVSLAVLALFSFLSSICAVMAVLPSVSSKPPDGQPNRLFFGHFAHEDEHEWVASILQDMKTEEAMFRMMAHDIYQNGQVLQRRKYRYLGLAYRIFMVGLVVTLVTFAVESLAQFNPAGL